MLAAAVLAAASPEVARGLSNCSASQLVPALGDVTVNQGVGNYTYRVRGKETLVKFFLTNPTTCAVTNTQSINITGATLTVNNTAQTFVNLGAFQSFAAAPAVTATVSTNSTADPIFAVPAADLVPPLSSPDTQTFTPTFTATVTYSRKSGTTTTTGLTATFSNSSAVFDHRTRALRVLVVPMGDATPGVLASSQYTSTDQTSTQNGFSALSRIFPVPSGVDSISGSTGGIRYVIDLSTMLNLKAISGAYDTNNKFCGAAGNFDAIKAQLAQFMQSWNANPLNVNAGKQVDRVLGVVGEGISDGADSAFGCADGMASVVSPEAWVRAIADKPASGRVAAVPSRTGSLMAMELTHTWGGATTTTFHSSNLTADVTAPGRAYNVTTRSYLATNRSVMKYSFVSSPPWDDSLTLLEPTHYAFDLCAFGGTTTTDCAGLGSTSGTTFGVAAGPSFVVSGVVHSSTNTADIVQSGFQNSLQLGRDDGSLYRYVRRDSVNGQLLTNIGFNVSFIDSVHGTGASENDDPATSDGLFSFALPDALPPPSSDLAEVQLWKVASSSHTNPSATLGDILLYDKTQQASPPQVLSTSSGAAAGAVKYTDTPSIDELHPALTDDTKWVAWNQFPTSGFQGIKVGPSSSSANAVTDDAAGPGAREPAWSAQGTALAYASDGDLYTQSVNLTGATPTFGDPMKIYDTPTNGAPAEHPSWSKDGKWIAFDRSGDIYKLPSAGGTLVQMTNNSENESDPSWSHTPGDNRIAYNRGPTGCEACFPATKLYVLNPDSPKFTQTKVNDEGAFPSFGTNGRIAFVRHDDQNIWSERPDGTDAKQLTTGGEDTLPSTAGNALAFDRIFMPPASGQEDIMLAGLTGGQSVTITAQSNVPLKAELDYECNGTAYPVRVGLVPDEINGAVQTFNTNFDGSNACGGGVLRALVTDGVQYASGSAITPTITVAPKTPTAAIFAPIDTTYPQLATFALNGTGYDAEGFVLPGSSLHWTLTLPDSTVQDLGNFSAEDLKAPAGGWPIGTLTFTLVASDGSTTSAPVTRSVHVVYDFVTGGFLPPIMNPPQVNSASAGSTIPIKWQLRDVNGNFITDTKTVQSVTDQTADCAFTQPFGSTPIALPTGGTFLRYDTSTNQFVYNWNTPTTPGCYVFTLTLIDGTQHQAYFNFK
jgi:hypothetical protein